MQPMFVSVVGAKYSSPLALPQRHARRQGQGFDLNVNLLIYNNKVT